MESERDLRAVSDRMMEMIDRLREVEAAKRDDMLGSEAFVRHAQEAEDLSRLLFRWAGIQLQMAHASVGAVERGELDGLVLSEVRTRPLDRILANWREAQLRFEIAKPGSPEAAAAADEVEKLREEFQAARAERMADGPG